MKCTNCGKNEVNFYYESNVNGKITRQQLCSECAQKLGFGTEDFFKESREMFNHMLGGFSDFFGTRRRAFPFGGFGLPTMLLPELFLPGTEVREHEDGCTCGDCETHQDVKEADNTADGEMNARRQINVLRAEMQNAIHAEEFEKAAELRDQIRALEKGENK
jgi:protein arginine kinase activator